MRINLKIVAICGCAAGVAVAGLLVGCTTTQTVKSGRPVEYVVNVESSAPWQNSGIAVRSGEIIHCMAEGKWSDDFGVYGPEGESGRERDNFDVAAPANGLLLRISGQTNRVYFVGKQANVVAQRSGHIYLRNNATLTPGAQGRLKVTLMVAPDTDGDGLSDYEELYLWRTNPLRQDSNGAGFTDLEIISDRRVLIGEGVLKPAAPVDR